jgi:hypothetical protein
VKEGLDMQPRDKQDKEQCTTQCDGDCQEVMEENCCKNWELYFENM